MKWVLPVLAALLLAAPAQGAGDRSSKQQQINIQLKRFHHADGFIKSIGRVAHRTQYSSNPVTRLTWTARLHELLRVREDALHKLKILRRVSSVFPPHHALWLCIGGFEGSWSDTSPPYTGGLQMHLNWYGLSNAGYYTQAQQEWTAERAWQAHGYSWSFLNDQWFKWDAADGCYSST
jgi:hypothetical protein